MELQEAKSIYRAIRNDYQLFVGDKKFIGQIADGRDLYTILGVYDDVKPYLSRGQANLLDKIVEKNREFYSRWYDFHEEVSEKKSEIEYSKLLTRKQKEKELLSLRDYADKELSKLNNLSEKNQKEMFKANEEVIKFLESVGEILRTELSQELYPKNLYDLDTINPNYKQSFLEGICPPYVPYTERDWGYYHSKRLDVQFEEFADKLRKKTVGQFAEQWRQEQYAKKLGYTNATEWKAKKFEEHLEQLDLEQVMLEKQKLAYQKLEEEGGEEKASGLFDKIINGWRPEDE